MANIALQAVKVAAQNPEVAQQALQTAGTVANKLIEATSNSFNNIVSRKMGDVPNKSKNSTFLNELNSRPQEIPFNRPNAYSSATGSTQKAIDRQGSLRSSQTSYSSQQKEMPKESLSHLTQQSWHEQGNNMHTKSDNAETHTQEPHQNLESENHSMINTNPALRNEVQIGEFHNLENSKTNSPNISDSMNDNQMIHNFVNRILNSKDPSTTFKQVLQSKGIRDLISKGSFNINEFIHDDKSKFGSDVKLNENDLSKYFGLTANGPYEYKSTKLSPVEFLCNEKVPHSLLIGCGNENEDAYASPISISYNISPVDSNYYMYKIDQKILPMLDNNNYCVMNNKSNSIVLDLF